MRKSFLAVLILIIMTFTLSGCGDSVKNELEKFTNADMTAVNDNYKRMKAAVGKWDSFTTDVEFIKSLEEDVIPNINKSIELVDKIKPKTDEVKALKDKYRKMLDTYKDGYEKMLYAFKNNNEILANEGRYTISKAIDLLEEYNTSLEELAKDKNMSVKY